MVQEGLEKRLGELEIKGRIETIQTTALLKSTWLLKQSWRPEKLAVTQTSVKNRQCEKHKKWSEIVIVIY